MFTSSCRRFESWLAVRKSSKQTITRTPRSRRTLTIRFDILAKASGAVGETLHYCTQATESDDVTASLDTTIKSRVVINLYSAHEVVSLKKCGNFEMVKNKTSLV